MEVNRSSISICEDDLLIDEAFDHQDRTCRRLWGKASRELTEDLIDHSMSRKGCCSILRTILLPYRGSIVGLGP